MPLPHDLQSYYGHAYCHILTAALLRLAPAGEVLGLCPDAEPTECLHTVFRVPNTNVFLDAFGAARGDDGLAFKAHEFSLSGPYAWVPFVPEQLHALIPGRADGVRRARSFALRLLAAADALDN